MRILQPLTGLLTVSLFTMAVPAVAMSLHPMIYRVEAIKQHLVGQMETVPHPERPQVRMTTCEIGFQGLYDRYLYQEQAVVSQLDQPYRQRILLLTPDEAFRQVESRSFRIAEQADWAGLCDRPTVEREAVLEALGDHVCTVSIERVEETYVGKTPPEGCPTQYRGAVSIRNTVILHDRGMDTWDQGFDAEGNQVWGAEDAAYEFRWISPE